MFRDTFFLSGGLVVLMLLSTACDGAKQRTVLLRLPEFESDTDFNYGKILHVVPFPLNQFTLCHSVFLGRTSEEGFHNQIFNYSVSDVPAAEITTLANSDGVSDEPTAEVTTLANPDKDKRVTEIATFLSYDTSLTVRFIVHGDESSVNLDSNQSVNNIFIHLCFTWSSSTGVTEIYVNGLRIPNNNETAVSALGKTIQPDGVAFLGATNNKMYKLPWLEEIGEVHLWDKILSPEQIAEIAKCCSQLEGNLFSWNSHINLQTFNKAYISVSTLTLCPEDQQCSN